MTDNGVVNPDRDVMLLLAPDVAPVTLFRIVPPSGSVSVTLPSAPVGACSVIEPLVALLNTALPTVEPATPRPMALDPSNVNPGAAANAPALLY